MANIELSLAAGLDVAAAWVYAEGCRVAPSPAELADELDAAGQRTVNRAEDPERIQIKTSVRKMLRHGSYHPSGRGKPASEYLVGAAAKGRLPRINNLVDVINVVSLSCLLPISLVDVERAGTTSFTARRGRENESYVFNASGQVLDLRDLLLLARMPADVPCASPVKDSHATKVLPESRGVLGVIYAPAGLRRSAAEAAELLAGLLKHWGGADHCEWGVETSEHSPAVD